MSSLREQKLLRAFVKEVMDGFGNKNLGRDGVAGNLRYDVPTTGQRGGNILSDEESDDAKVLKAACCLIVAKDGRILAVSRKNDPNDFGLPGGKVDPGETVRAAAERELKEETGLDAVKLTQVFSSPDNQGYVTTTFSCEISGEISTDEAGVIRWVKPDVLIAGSFGDYNKRLLKHLGRL
jgi:8-oxo-dGTP pyrophosphatase MutT (NUDIX family)